MAASNPADQLKLDVEQLRTFRVSYHFLSYFGVEGGFPTMQDLPGVDRPEIVARHHAADQAWLEGDE